MGYRFAAALYSGAIFMLGLCDWTYRHPAIDMDIHPRPTYSSWSVLVDGAFACIKYAILTGIDCDLAHSGSRTGSHEGARTGTPMFYESKRGKIVGGYQLQGFWPVVLFLVVPFQGGGTLLPWTPLLGAGLWGGGWTIIGFPMMIGFADITLSRPPEEKARLSSNLLFMYAGAVLLLAALAYLGPVATLIACLGCILLHEGLRMYSRWDESNRKPYFVEDPRGLKILGVLPGSAGDEMGIQAGEIIHKVNGLPIRSKHELHHAMQLNSAFCKLEVLNLAGESKFLKRPMFSGEHHQLGILLVPDQDAPYYVEEKPVHFWRYLSRKLPGTISK